jgi:hypothetical protein
VKKLQNLENLKFENCQVSDRFFHVDYPRLKTLCLIDNGGPFNGTGWKPMKKLESLTLMGIDKNFKFRPLKIIALGNNTRTTVQFNLPKLKILKTDYIHDRQQMIILYPCFFQYNKYYLNQSQCLENMSIYVNDFVLIFLVEFLVSGIAHLKQLKRITLFINEDVDKHSRFLLCESVHDKLEDGKKINILHFKTF